jgi:hypothetical protein
MAELVVRVEGEPERVVPLPARPFLVGRAEGCDLVVLEKKASKKHLEIAPLAVPTADGVRWVVVDLQSSNGTFVGEQRVLRCGLAHGDVVRIGDSTLTLLDASAASSAAPSAATPSGRPLVVVAADLLVTPGTEAAAVAAGEEPVDAEQEARDEELAAAIAAATEARRADEAGRRAVTRGAVWLGVGVAAVVAAYLLAGGERDRRNDSSEEARAYANILAEREGDWRRLDSAARGFLEQWPRSRYATSVERLLEARSKAHEAQVAVEDELDALLAAASARPESEVVARLLVLKQKAAGDAGLAARVDRAMGDVARRRGETAERARLAAEGEADRALARGDAGAALRRWRAFREANPGLPEEQAERATKAEAAVREEAKRLAGVAIAKAEATTDPDARRDVLVRALQGLSETDLGETLRQALARVQGGSLPAAAPASAPGVPSAPTSAPPSNELLARATEAQRLATERAWAKAGEAYAALAASDASPRLKKEWGDRAQDLGRLASLVKDLSDAVMAAGERPLRVPLAGGTFDVLSADASAVRLRRADKTTEHPWAAVEPADLAALLAAGGKPTPDRHLALALLAAEAGDRKAAMDHLVPLAALDSHKALAFDVVARRLDGKPSVPQGGYQVLDGELLDQAEFGRRTEAKRVATLKAEAAALVAKVEADPVLKKVASLRARREELDKRRQYALLAIFNEKHWPYPHPASISGPYEAVWNEIVRRTNEVRAIWDEPTSVKVPKTGELQQHFDRHATILAELESKGVVVDELRAAMAKHSMYAGETLTIRTFFVDPDEKTLLAYNRWVVDVYNPGRTAVIAPPEREEVRITNEYRSMMGFMLRVEPGDDPLEAIEAKTVVRILDKAKETGRVALRAVRIDDRLVHSARDHSIDMAKRGYFAHEAPPNPATGEPATSPFDRMQKAGYTGGGMSENIAGAGSAQDAHDRWLHSSGHHRNILSDWADQGVGLSGMLWTQNFGVGGGAPSEIPATETPKEPAPPEGGMAR